MAILTKAFARRLAQHARHARTASTLADQRADEPQLWRGTSTVGDTTKLYINGEWVDSKATQFFDIHDPVRRAFNAREARL